MWVRHTEAREGGRRLSVALALSMLVFSAAAHADPARNDKAAAEALFAEGRKLMADGRYAEACPKFEASQRMDPGIGTMLNLAECYERTGRTASAWAEFREVVSAAREAGSPEREELARQRASALESTLSRLTVTANANAGVAGLEIRRNGGLVDAAELGSPIPVDPGEHTIEATAPGKRKWSHTVEIGADASSVTIEIPRLADAGEPARARPIERGVAGSESGGGRSLALPIVLGVTGLAGVGVGTVFGLKASSSWSDAKSHCDDYPYGCGERGVELAADARRSATISTIGFVTGAVGLGAGAVVFLTGGSSATDAGRASTSVAVGPGNVVVSGRF